MTVAERLVKVRTDNGYTRRQLSEELKMPYPTITKYENGQREPGHEYLITIAQKFGVTVDYLLGVETEKAPTPDWDERDVNLVSWFRSLPEEKQKAILASQDAPEGLV